jgi:hypothetical protein
LGTYICSLLFKLQILLAYQKRNEPLLCLAMLLAKATSLQVECYLVVSCQEDSGGKQINISQLNFPQVDN